MDLTALGTELLTDPVAMGYAAPLAAGNHTAVAGRINDLTLRTVPVSDVDEADLFGEADPADLQILTADQTSMLRALVGRTGTIRIGSANTAALLEILFPPGTATYLVIQGLKTRPGSRAEELGFPGVSHQDIARAIGG